MYREKINNLYLYAVGKLRTSGEITRLRNENDLDLRLLADILSDVERNRHSYEEQCWLEKIETLRKRLLYSPVKVTVIDYGAVSPDSNLTREETYNGIIEQSSVGDIYRNSVSSSRKWAYLLFRIIRKFRPATSLELGTGLGVSTMYEAAALELNHYGKIITLEGAESLGILARDNFKELGLERVEVVAGRFQDNLPEVLRQYAPIDFVFIDGHHDEGATLGYFRHILPFLSDISILVFDDIYWSAGMKKAWKAIQGCENIKASVELFNIGIAISRKPAPIKIKPFKMAI
jgi:predicted O-methyltransferase YrrM